MFGTLTQNGIRNESSAATWQLGSSITGYDDVGKTVSVNAAANFTVETKVAGAEILGYLESYEDRVAEGIKVGAVSWHGCYTFPYTGTAPTPGAHVMCNAAGGVAVATGTLGLHTIVTSVDTVALTCEVLLK